MSFYRPRPGAIITVPSPASRRRVAAYQSASAHSKFAAIRVESVTPSLPLPVLTSWRCQSSFGHRIKGAGSVAR